MSEQRPIPEAFLTAFSPGPILIPDIRPYLSEPVGPFADPRDVVRNTGTALRDYLQGDRRTIDREAMARYLSRHTLNFLIDALQGNMLAHYLKAENRPRTLERAFVEEREMLVSPHAWEAYGLSSHIFANIAPEFGTIEDAHLTPPPNPPSFNRRIHEMHREITRIVAGRIDPGTDIRTTASLFRTYAFMETGARILQ